MLDVSQHPGSLVLGQVEYHIDILPNVTRGQARKRLTGGILEKLFVAILVLLDQFFANVFNHQLLVEVVQAGKFITCPQKIKGLSEDNPFIGSYWQNHSRCRRLIGTFY